MCYYGGYIYIFDVYYDIVGVAAVRLSFVKKDRKA